MWRKLLYVVPALVTLLVLLSGAQCFPRQCSGPEHCQRVCTCNDRSTGTTVDCPFFASCDTQAGICGDDYNMSCDEVCSRFAARDMCGTKTCKNEADCVRNAVCQIAQAETGALICTYTCQVTFDCDLDVGACDVAFGLDDAALCGNQQLCPPPTDGSCG